MFESLDPPADLGSARARLGEMIDHLVVQGDGLSGAPAPVVHLDRPDRGPGPALDWPVVDPGSLVVADAVLWRASTAQLRSLSRAIGPEQVLLFLEPTRELGWRRALHRAARPLWRRLTGHDFERDLPADLRAAGLEVTELTRFGTGPRQVWSYALGRAEHIRGRVDGGR